MPGMPGTMKEFSAGTLHSGSKTGPKVTNRKQAIAIGMNEEKKGKDKGGAHVQLSQALKGMRG